VEVPHAVWHEAHTFTVFAYPTFSEEDMQQIAHALVKVTEAYSGKGQKVSKVGGEEGHQ